MARFTRLIEGLSETFRRSGARALHYFHTDHFEPWRSMGGRIDVSEPNGADIADFLDQTAKLDYARRLTLFLKPAFRIAMAGQDVRSAEGDGVGFRPLTEDEVKIHHQALAEIGKSSHELQVHVHHEYCTRNAMYATLPQYNKDERVRAYLADETTPALDEARFKLLLDMTLELYRRGSRRKLDRWFFVHGMWALNGSDRDVCNIDSEIGLLLDKGCLGDFTFPAGRAHTDPVHKAPFFCKSVNTAKCYDLAEAEPAFAWGAKPEGRFFIWSSAIKHQQCSIDYYSKEIRAGLEDIERAAQDLVQTSVFVDGQLYIKTHAHSMMTDYFDNIRRPIYPHFHPGVQALIGVVLDAASDAGLDIRFPTAGEVYDQFVAAHHEGSVDIASDEHTIRRRQTSQGVANAMTPLERLEAFAPMVMSASHEVVGRRLAAMGPTESGAYEYYEDLFARDNLIHPYEIAVARHLATRLPDGARVHEFGTGFGSMALLLAVSGFEVVAIDADPRRLATAAAVRAELAKHVPWVSGRLNFKEGAIPAVLSQLDGAGVTAVATDVTSGLTLDELAALVEVAGARYQSVVFDVERFFARAVTADEQGRVLELFERHYLVCEPITDESVGRLFFHAGAGWPDTEDPRAARASPRDVSTLDEAVKVVDEAGVAIIETRIAERGVDGSGAGAFYAQIVGAGRLVQPYDLAVASWLLGALPVRTPILEVGAGVGSLALTLAAVGRRVTALDLNARRVALGRQIKARVGQRLGRDLDNLDFIEAKFPLARGPTRKGDMVVVITNMVFGWTEDQQREMLAELATYKSAVIDADRFGVQRATQEERDAFDGLVAEAGLAMSPLDLVADMRFVRLTRLVTPIVKPVAAAPAVKKEVAR